MPGACRWSSSWRCRRPSRCPRRARARCRPACGTAPAAPATARRISTGCAWPGRRPAGVSARNAGASRHPRVPAGGQVSLRGLPELVAVEILYGLQQRTGAGFATRLHVLRAAAEELRRSGAVSILAAVGVIPGRWDGRNEPSSARWAVTSAVGSVTPGPSALRTCGTCQCSALPAGSCRSPPSARAGCGRPPSGGPLMTCPVTAAPARTPGSSTSSTRSRACQRICASPAATTASSPVPLAAPTSNLSCTVSPTWNRPGRSHGTGGCGSART